MQRIKSVLFSSIMILAAVACGGADKAGDTTAKQGPTCEQAAQSLADTMRAQIADMGDAEIAAIRDGIASSCTSDGWSAEVIACFDGAQSPETAQGCADKLTPAQQESFAASMMGDGGAPPEPDEAPDDDSEESW